MKKNYKRLLGSCVFMLSVVGLAHADEMKTPYGAEYSGSADGFIPAWQGGQDNKHTFGPELLNKQPLYTVDASNLDEHRSSIPDGLQSLLEKYPASMKVPVYQSHRPAYYPDWVYQAIEKNKASATLANDGNSVVQAFPGIPFPDPKNGHQAVWNHLLAFKGVQLESNTWEVVVRKDRQSGVITSNIKYSVGYYQKTRGPSDEDQMLMYLLSTVTSPSRLSGSALLVHEPVNTSVVSREAWSYVAGQRRVMRAPSIKYDSPLPSAEGIRLADEFDLYSGSVDHYQWRLVGKQALIVPYNNERLYQSLAEFESSQDTLLTPYHPNPDMLRYEKHRVWVVEGVLNEGKSHPYQRRVLYLDEDSWLALMAENYDQEGRLWRVSTSYSKFYHELPGVYKVADVFHDLTEEAYYVQGLLIKEGRAIKTQDSVAKKSKFKPSVLRRLGRK
ncbi:DUF1329 domain-containing protein [Litoribacillus peritrichatus]|uniref:DUF1329 domain-containing protein n=1 Tax=Litoribacillus peritrichatus TaxID=718191 RepID=A0ABP7MQB5_9GAMM